MLAKSNALCPCHKSFFSRASDFSRRQAAMKKAQFLAEKFRTVLSKSVVDVDGP
jgi:hypothetical protein